LLTPTPEVDFDLPAGQVGEESETDETEENETEPNDNEESPTDSETNNEDPQEGSEDEFWDIDLDDLLNPNPEVDDNEETDEITTPEFPIVGVDEDEEDEGNNEDYTEPATDYTEPDKTEPEDTLTEENEEEETEEEPDND